MTYDFVILHSGTAQGGQHALSIADRSFQQAPGPRTPGGPMDRFLQDLVAQAGNNGFLEEVVRADDGLALLGTDHDDIAANTSVITATAAAHGLAVLDPQIPILLDMAGALPISLSNDDWPALTHTSAQMIGAVLEEIVGGRYPWLVIERRGGAYAQTYRNDDGRWDVEYRDAGPDTHQRASTFDRAAVEAFLWAWALDAPGATWRTAFPFVHVEL